MTTPESRNPEVKFPRARKLFEALNARDPEMSEDDWKYMGEKDKALMEEAINEVFPLAVSETANPDSSTPDGHKARHVKLHRALDELFADYIQHHPEQHNFMRMPLGDLIEWSHQQTIIPTEVPTYGERRG